MATTARMLNLDRVKRRLAAIPQAMTTAAGSQLAVEVEDLTAAIQANTPVSDLDTHPGQLRESVHFYPNRSRPLSYIVLADARDEKGEFIGPHVEHGHKARDGSHVPRNPFFFPTYRAHKKAMQRRLKAASRKAAKALFPGEANG